MFGQSLLKADLCATISFMLRLRNRFVFFTIAVVLVLFRVWVIWLLNSPQDVASASDLAVLSHVINVIFLAVWAIFSRSLAPLIAFFVVCLGISLAQLCAEIYQDREWQQSLLLIGSSSALAAIMVVLLRIMRYSRQQAYYQKVLLEKALGMMPVKVGIHKRNGNMLLTNEESYLNTDAIVNHLQSSSFVKHIWARLDKKKFSDTTNDIKGRIFQHKFSTVNAQTLYQIGYGLLNIPAPSSNSADDHLLIYALDVSERERMMLELLETKEEAERASRAKTQFLANVSHELRTPLTAIVGFSQLMSTRQDLDDDLREMVSTVTRNGESLLELVNDVLDLSKAETGHLNLNAAPFELTTLLYDEMNIIRPQVEAKGLALRVKSTLDVPFEVISDASKIRQVLRNLLSNAWKFTDKGRIEVRVWSSDLAIWYKELRPQPPEFTVTTLERLYDITLAHIPKEQHKIMIHMEVLDTGQGIDAQELYNIFEPFIQTRSGIASSQGTGLGLAISKKFALFLEGDLSLESQVGQGTSCHFYFLADRV